MAVEQNDALKIVASFDMPGLTIAQNVFYASYTAVGDATEEDVTDDLLAWVEKMFDNLDGQIADTVSLNEVVVSKKIGASPLTWEEIGNVAGAFVGLDTTEAVPNGVAMVLRVATTALRSLARKYIAGLSETDTLTTSWSSTALVNGALFLADWILGPDTVAGRTYIPGIVSTLDGFFKTFGNEGVISAIPGYQRRRKPGVGA